jgi:hypothetical protein
MAISGESRVIVVNSFVIEKEIVQFYVTHLEFLLPEELAMVLWLLLLIYLDYWDNSGSPIPENCICER